MTPDMVRVGLLLALWQGARLTFGDRSKDTVTRGHRFEDMPSWQDARQLTRQIYQLTAAARFADDLVLGERIRQAAASSMVHIATGADCASRDQVAQCLQLARHSIAEVQSLLYIALDMGYISAEMFRNLYEQAASVVAQVNDLEQKN